MLYWQFTPNVGQLALFYLFKTFQLTFVSGVSCDFDSGTCGFVQSRSDAFDWKRTHGRTSTLGTGPTQDHTGLGNNI